MRISQTNVTHFSRFHITLLSVTPPQFTSEVNIRGNQAEATAVTLIWCLMKT